MSGEWGEVEVSVSPCGCLGLSEPHSHPAHLRPAPTRPSPWPSPQWASSQKPSPKFPSPAELLPTLPTWTRFSYLPACASAVPYLSACPRKLLLYLQSPAPVPPPLHSFPFLPRQNPYHLSPAPQPSTLTLPRILGTGFLPLTRPVCPLPAWGLPETPVRGGPLEPGIALGGA